MMSNEQTTFTLDLQKPDTNHRLSSNDLSDLITSGCISADFLLTYISRYPRLSCDLQNTYGATTASNGPCVDFTAEHAWIGILETVLVGCVALANAVITYKSIRKGKERVSYKPVYEEADKLVDVANEAVANLKSKAAEMTIKERTAAFNAALNNVLKTNAKLSDRYKEINVVKSTPNRTTGKTKVTWDVTLVKQAAEVDYEICEIPANGNSPREKGKLYVRLSDAHFQYEINGITSAAINRILKKEDLGITDNTPLTLQDLESRKSLIFKVMRDKKNHVIQESDSIGSAFKKLFRETGTAAVKVADNTSDMMGITSYSYWILYMSAAVVTGMFALGVFGIPDILAFGLPLLAGSAYIFRKGSNWKKNRHFNKKERDDFNALTEATLLSEEEKNALNLVHENHKNTVLYNEENTSKITIPTTAIIIATSSLSAAVGTYVAWQYNMWFISDFLIKVGQVASELIDVASSAVGIGIFVTAVVCCVRAGYEAYKTYQQNKADNKNAKEPGADQSFWEYYKSLRKEQGLLSYFKLNSTLLLEQQQRKINALEKQLRHLKYEHSDLRACDREKLLPQMKTPVLDARLQQAREADEKSKNKWQFLRDIWHVFNFGMTGVFVARSLVIKGLTPFLLPGMVAALSFATMGAPIAILAVAGIVWGVYKYCVYRQAKNLQKLKEANDRIGLLEKKINLVNQENLAIESMIKRDVKPEPPKATMVEIPLEKVPKTLLEPAITSEVEMSAIRPIIPANPAAEEKKGGAVSVNNNSFFSKAKTTCLTTKKTSALQEFSYLNKEIKPDNREPKLIIDNDNRTAACA